MAKNNQDANKVWGAVKAIEELVKLKLNDMNYYYKLAEEKRISDPEVSDIYGAKGDVISDQLNLIKLVSEIFGLKFRLYELDTGEIMATEPKYEGRR